MRLVLNTLLLYLYPLSKASSSSNSRMLTASNNTYHQNMCPVTSLFDFKTDGYFKYPVDLFEPHLHKVLLTQLHHKTGSKDTQSKLYNCTSERNDRGMDGVDQFPHPKHVCTDGVERKCPVSPDYVSIAMEKSFQWLYPNESTIPFLYHIWEAMMDRDAVIRVIVLGGSAARGSEAAGCYCNPILDTRCQAFNHSSFRRSRTTNFHTESPDCRWSTFFVKWLMTLSDATIQPIYHTYGGFHPNNGGIFLQDNFKSGKFGALTRHDIVIFDYSMNEAKEWAGRLQGSYQQQLITERAIRTVFIMTDESEQVPPVIFLTETFSDHGQMEIRQNFTATYTIAYNNIARHYNIPIFSYLDVFHSDRLRREHTNVFNALNYKGSHPLWFNHQFYADLLADVFLSEFRRSYDFALQQGPDEVSRRIQALPLINESIPNPLSPEVNDEEVCDSSVRPLLDIAAADYLSKEKSTNWLVREKSPSIGWFSSESDSFHLVEERGEKYGWVHELKSDYGSSERVPKSMRFYLSDPNGELFSQDHLIKLSYLRTYKNAGRIRIKFCGQLPNNNRWDTFLGSNSLNTFDALWPDYQVNKLSLNEYAFPMISREGFDKQMCTEEIKDNSVVRAYFANKQQQKEEQDLQLVKPTGEVIHPYLEVIHEPVCVRTSDHHWCVERLPSEKFKITGIKICRRNRNN